MLEPAIAMTSEALHVLMLTVIIPTFRRNDKLTRSLRSVLSEPINAMEVLVIDDSPEGAARDTVMSMDDPRVRYIHNEQPSQGRPALVRNIGIEQAQGKYLYFLDDDDQVAPGGLPALINALEQNPTNGVAYGAVNCVGPDPAIQARYQRWFGWAARTSRRIAWSRRLTVGVIMFRGTLIINSACLIRRDLAKKLGGYDSTIPVYEDVEFFTRGIRETGHQFVNVPVLQYSTGEQSIIHDLGGDSTKVVNSYDRMHQKYRSAHGTLEYRVLQVLAKLLPIGRAPVVTHA